MGDAPFGAAPCTTGNLNRTLGSELGTVTWRDEQRDARVLQYQAAAAVIHLPSRKHQQLVHQQTDDGLALRGREQLLVKGGHLRQGGRRALRRGLIFGKGSGIRHWLLLTIQLPAGPQQPVRTVPSKALDQKEGTGYRNPHQQ